jgi:hypothetical protein
MMSFLTHLRTLSFHTVVLEKDGTTGITSILSIMLLQNSVFQANLILPSFSLTVWPCADKCGTVKEELLHGQWDAPEETEMLQMENPCQSLHHVLGRSLLTRRRFNKHDPIGMK